MRCICLWVDVEDISQFEEGLIALKYGKLAFIKN